MDEKQAIEKPVVKKKTHFEAAFAVLLILIAFAYIAAITFCNIPAKNIRFADTTLGFLLGTVIYAIITWAFRSSKAQVDKESAELQIKQLNGKGEKS